MGKKYTNKEIHQSADLIAGQLACADMDCSQLLVEDFATRETQHFRNHFAGVLTHFIFCNIYIFAERERSMANTKT